MYTSHLNISIKCIRYFLDLSSLIGLATTNIIVILSTVLTFRLFNVFYFHRRTFFYFFDFYIFVPSKLSRSASFISFKSCPHTFHANDTLSCLLSRFAYKSLLILNLAPSTHTYTLLDGIHTLSNIVL